MYWFFTLVGNTLRLKFYLQCFLIDLFGKATSQILVNSHSCTNNLICLFLMYKVACHDAYFLVNHRFRGLHGLVI